MTTQEIKKEIIDYVNNLDNNCIIKVNEKYGVIYVMTTKDISKSSELLIPYGFIYWFNKVNHNIDKLKELLSTDKELIIFLENNYPNFSNEYIKI
jgi:hypothetical protein